MARARPGRFCRAASFLDLPLLSFQTLRRFTPSPEGYAERLGEPMEESPDGLGTGKEAAAINAEKDALARQLRRRGLMAAVAGAMAGLVVKRSGAPRAEAAATALLYPGLNGDSATTNTSY